MFHDLENELHVRFEDIENSISETLPVAVTVRVRLYHFDQLVPVFDHRAGKPVPFPVGLPGLWIRDIFVRVLSCKRGIFI